MITRTGALAVLLALCASVPALAAPATVNLRIEGEAETVFEGPIRTDAKIVTTPSGGAHRCDGTNGGASAVPGPTVTTALDDASAAAGFSWDGRYGVGGFDDFLIERIAGDGQVGVFGGKFWSISVNRVDPMLGGCQAQVRTGDEVLLSWQAFGDPNLHLTAPPRAAVGRPFGVTVQRYGIDGALSPAPGAAVAGSTTGGDGRATIAFVDEGLKRFKATLPGAVRSNAAAVCVSADGTGDCGVDPGTLGTTLGGPLAADSRAPVVRVISPRDGRRYRRGPRLLRGVVSGGSALSGVHLRLRRVGAGGCRWFSGKREIWTRPRRGCRSARFFRVGDRPEWSYLLPGSLAGRSRYVLDVKALDRAGRAGRARVRFSVRGR